MAGLNATQLPVKKKSREPKRAGRKPCPYTVDMAATEDTKRARLAQQTQKKMPRPDRKAIKSLIKRLTDEDVPSTAASARRSFDISERITDHLVGLTWRLPEGEVFTATLIPQTSKHGSLKRFSARKWAERLRQDLRRVGGRTVDGWVFAGIHGEHNPDTDLYDIHYHLVICGRAMKAVIERLRKRGKYQLADVSEAAPDDVRTPPIYIRTVSRDDLRFTLSYATQHWWPSRKRGRDAQGKPFAGARRRLPGVRHTEWLLWMDRQPPQHLYLLFNLRVGRTGLVAKKPLKACTPIKKAGGRND